MAEAEAPTPLEPGQVLLPRAEFIDDVAKFVAGRNVEQLINNLSENKQKYKMLESQFVQRKVRLMTKLPEIQKTLDIVNALIEKAGAEMLVDYQLTESMYAKARVEHVTSVNLWLGADVMVEYPLEEAKELMENNLRNCQINIKTVEHDLEVIRDNITMLEVSVARIWNHDVEQRRLAKEAGPA